MSEISQVSMAVPGVQIARVALSTNVPEIITVTIPSAPWPDAVSAVLDPPGTTPQLCVSFAPSPVSAVELNVAIPGPAGAHPEIVILTLEAYLALPEEVRLDPLKWFVIPTSL